MRMKDKVVLITGGAAGIGKATAQRFLEEGAQVVFCDINEAAGQATAQELGSNAAFYKVNVANRQEVQAWVDDAAARYGRIDVLVNNAGILRDGQAGQVQRGCAGGADVRSRFRPGHLGQSQGRLQLRAGGCAGDDKAGQRGHPERHLHRRAGWQLRPDELRCPAWAGVVGMTKVWARELGKYGIRVCAVAPGFTATEIQRSMPEKIIESMKARTPLGRMEPAARYCQCVSLPGFGRSYRFITGIVLRVDGGIVVGT